MIHAENVSKRYGKLLANDRVNIDIGPGETAILLGPNGAGKSTIIKSIAACCVSRAVSLSDSVLKLLEQTYSPKKPDIYCQSDNDLVHLFCF
ncbi:MAG: ATP-binding cassette domain-containing protein [Spirochaetaceae bacterium]|nr:ATP-binding cassette domain-containing protein [Spirochaetaceae bacterium]